MSPNALLNGRVLTAATMLAVFVTMSLMALGFPEKARLMPLMVGVPGSVLGLAQLFIELRTALNRPPDLDAGQGEAHGNERFMLAWTLLFFVGILAFGFLYAAPLLVFGFLCLGKKESLAVGLAGASATWAVLFGLFESVFQIPLFEGLAVAWILA